MSSVLTRWEYIRKHYQESMFYQYLNKEIKVTIQNGKEITGILDWNYGDSIKIEVDGKKIGIIKNTIEYFEVLDPPPLKLVTT